MRKVREIMRQGFLFLVSRDATISEAVRTMTEHNVGLVIVMDDERPAGVVSERDVVRRVVDRGLDPARTPVAEVMTTDLVTADSDEDYQSAMRRMDAAGIRHLLVTSQGRLLSTISIRDLVREAMREKEEELVALREYLYQVPTSEATGT